MLRTSIAALLALALASPHVARAQAPARPHWSVGLALGVGPHTTRADDVHYGSSRSNTGQLAIAYRFGAGALRPMLRAELLTEGPGSDWDDCPLAPNGTCRRDFPAPDGVGAAAGLAYTPTARIELGVLAGAGRYDATTRGFVEAEGALGVTRRLAVTVAVRHMAWDEPGLGRHWYRPVHVGARARW
jgi:hypothetical protein